MLQAAIMMRVSTAMIICRGGKKDLSSVDFLDRMGVAVNSIDLEPNGWPNFAVTVKLLSEELTHRPALSVTSDPLHPLFGYETFLIPPNNSL